MAEPSPASVDIACPQCGTRYRLPRETVGAGRLVQCANCKSAWEAQGDAPMAPAETAEADALFDSAAETQLDSVFEALDPGAAEHAPSPVEPAPPPLSVEEVKRAIAPRPKPAKAPESAALRKQRQAFSRRQAKIRRQLPMGRVRHTARIAALTALMLLVGGGIVWRNAVVDQLPDLAGFYTMIGLPVNLNGLAFENVQTLETLTEGAQVLTVSGRIASVADVEVGVPPIVVTLLGQGGAALYQWSVAPRAAELKPGETVDFETRLTQPPPGATRVRLSFGASRQQTGAVTIAAAGKGT